MDKMFEKIVKDIRRRIKNQPNSLCASDDEVSICWLVLEVQFLRKQIADIKKILTKS